MSAGFFGGHRPPLQWTNYEGVVDAYLRIPMPRMRTPIRVPGASGVTCGGLPILPARGSAAIDIVVFGEFRKYAAVAFEFRPEEGGRGSSRKAARRTQTDAPRRLKSVFSRELRELRQMCASKDP